MNGVTMSRLELAAERLATALEMLEKAADSAAQTRAPAPDALARINALESERQMLLSRIAALEDELAALSGITDEVEGRLDGAIGEIRAALARS
jgi:predicted  nucleic acid-binding Zn-ribbon protein